MNSFFGGNIYLFKTSFSKVFFNLNNLIIIYYSNLNLPLMPKKKGQDPPVNRKKRVPNTDKLELQ